jgi:hypothetical protein
VYSASTLLWYAGSSVMQPKLQAGGCVQVCGTGAWQGLGCDVVHEIGSSACMPALSKFASTGGRARARGGWGGVRSCAGGRRVASGGGRAGQRAVLTCGEVGNIKRERGPARAVGGRVEAPHGAVLQRHHGRAEP